MWFVTLVVLWGGVVVFVLFFNVKDVKVCNNSNVKKKKLLSNRVGRKKVAR